MPAHAHGGHGVGQIVAAQKVGLHGIYVVAVFEIEFHIRIGTHIRAFGVGIGGLAIGNAAQRLAVLHQYVVVGIDENLPAFSGKVSVKFCFGVDYALKRAKPLQMCLAHVGDKSEIGFCDMAEKIDLARVVGAHLHHGNLGVQRHG